MRIVFLRDVYHEIEHVLRRDRDTVHNQYLVSIFLC